MDPNARLSALRDLLAGAPTHEVWRSICDVLGGWPVDDPGLNVALDYARVHLEGWPLQLRLAPSRWLLARAEHPAHQLATAVDLSSLRLDDDGFRRLLRARRLDGIGWLDLSDNRLGARAVADLEAHAALTPIQHLNLAGNGIGARGAVTLSRIDALSRLRHLDLSHNTVGPDGVAALCSGPMADSLQYLDLTDTNLGPDGARHLNQRSPPRLASLRMRRELPGRTLSALVDGLVLPSLRALELHFGSMLPADAESLASSAFGSLEALRLHGAINPRALSALLGEGGFDSLATLALTSSTLGPAGLSALARCPAPPALTHLDLSFNALMDEAAGELAAWSAMAGVSDLTLAGCSLGDGGLAALGRGFGRALVSLDLSGHNGLSAKGLQRGLATAPSLLRLNLSDNPLGAGLAAWLEESAAPLEHLALNSAQLDDDEVARILGGDLCAGLRTLDIAGNRLSSRTCEALAQLHAPSLESLDLSYNPLGHTLLDALSRAHLPQLRELRLRHTRLSSPSAAHALSRCDSLASLRVLDLGDNPLGDLAARSIARSAALANLRHLGMRNTGLSTDGLAILLSSEELRRLETLDASNNDVGIASLWGIAERSGAPRLDVLDLTGNRMADLVSRIGLFTRRRSDVKLLFR